MATHRSSLLQNADGSLPLLGQLLIAIATGLVIAVVTYSAIASSDPISGPGDEGSAPSTSILNGASSDNAVPTAAPDAAVASVGETIVVDVLSNDTDPEGAPLRLTDVEALEGATAAPVAGGIELTVSPGASGTASISYTVRDSLGAEAVGRLTVDIR